MRSFPPVFGFSPFLISDIFRESSSLFSVISFSVFRQVLFSLFQKSLKDGSRFWYFLSVCIKKPFCHDITTPTKASIHADPWQSGKFFSIFFYIADSLYP
jgi:hypothetical protein